MVQSVRTLYLYKLAWRLSKERPKHVAIVRYQYYILMLCSRRNKLFALLWNLSFWCVSRKPSFCISVLLVLLFELFLFMCRLCRPLTPGNIRVWENVRRLLSRQKARCKVGSEVVVVVGTVKACSYGGIASRINPLNTELNPICQ